MKRQICGLNLVWFFLSLNLSATTPVPLTMTYSVSGELCAANLIITSLEAPNPQIILDFKEDAMTFSTDKISPDECGCTTYEASFSMPEEAGKMLLVLRDRSKCSCKSRKSDALKIRVTALGMNMDDDFGWIEGTPEEMKNLVFKMRGNPPSEAK